jgi:hypothetical protein
MAKKTVTKTKGDITTVKIIRMVKSDKNGAYRFKEDIVDKNEANSVLKGK